MKKLIRMGLLIACLAIQTPAFAEDWKGEPDGIGFDFGGLVGLGIVDSSSGVATIGTLSRKIISKGFVPDISNSVSVEGQFGPIFIPQHTAWFYSAHLRWDFNKSPAWTFYGLGGFGGNIMSSRVEIFPRLGAGAIWKVDQLVWLRGEVSHELTAVGVTIPF